MSNVPPRIAALAAAAPLHRAAAHPLALLTHRLRAAFPALPAHLDLPPAVAAADNFDALRIPPAHPSRSRSDTFYLDNTTVLRTHTSAHQLECLRRLRSEPAPGFVVAGPVFRRDEIDRFHYPVFHQLEVVRVLGDGLAVERALREEEAAAARDASGVRVVVLEDAPVAVHDTTAWQPQQDPAVAALVLQHLKLSMLRMLRHVWASEAPCELRVRWVPTTFPFTRPSLELEMLLARDGDAHEAKGEKWLELCGCGVTHGSILEQAGWSAPPPYTWALGLGLERLAMPLFGIPDIRAFWSKDPRVTAQWQRADDPGALRRFVVPSRYPETRRDVSFWEGQTSKGAWSDNDVHGLVREEAGDWVERVECIDRFTRGDGRTSHCFRITYRAMDRTVTSDEVNEVQGRVRARLVQELGVELR